MLRIRFINIASQTPYLSVFTFQFSVEKRGCSFEQPLVNYIAFLAVLRNSTNASMSVS